MTSQVPSVNSLLKQMRFPHLYCGEKSTRGSTDSSVDIVHVYFCGFDSILVCVKSKMMVALAAPLKNNKGPRYFFSF